MNAAFVTPSPFKKAGSDVFVRLTCKLANFLDGLDVTDVRVGDVIELSEASALMLVAEGWAERASDPEVTDRPRQSPPQERTG